MSIADVQAANSWDFGYTGSIQQITAPYSGLYKLEVWGASGGDHGGHGGKGGYTSVEIEILQGTTLYVTCGGAGSYSGQGGYNGGGDSTEGGSGGGATHIATSSGLLRDLSGDRASILAVAGGGGGSYSAILPNQPAERVIYGTDIEYYNSDAYTYGGHGGGTIGGRTYTEVDPSGCYCLQTLPQPGTQTTGFSFGQGQSGNSGAGGGLYGGYAGQEHYIGSSGGSGYFIETLYNSDTKTGVNNGNGRARIQYLGELTKTITVITGDGGTYEGRKGTITFQARYGDTITLNNIQTEGEYQFSEWRDENNIHVEPTFRVTKDVKFKAYYIAPLIVTREYTGPNTLTLYMSQTDAYKHYYKIWQSHDGTNWYNAAFSEDADGRNPNINDYNKQYTPGSYIYDVKITTDYLIRLYGGSGGNAYASWGTGYGGKGAYTEGVIRLNKGDKLYVNIGSRGSDATNNNKGSAFASGGEASDIRYGGNGIQNRIQVSAGGGGAAGYDRNGDNPQVYNGTDGGALASVGNSSITAGGAYISNSHGATQTRGDYVEWSLYNSNSNLDAGGHAESYQDGRNMCNECPNIGGYVGWHPEMCAGGYYPGIAGYIDWGILPGSGGSSYISGYNGCIPYIHSSGKRFTNPSMQAGVRSGDGIGYISMASDFKLENAEKMTDIYFFDKEAPNNLTDGLYKYAGDTIKITWKDNGDRGTKYYHKVESYNEADQLVHTSGVLEDYLESGIKGYHYYIDKNTTGTVTTDNSFVAGTLITIPMITETQYMHVAAIDNAGNLGETYTFQIPAMVKITYDRNNETNNRYGDTVSTNASGSLSKSEIRPDVAENRIKYNRTEGSDVAYTKEGYTFRGIWNTRSDGTGDMFTEGQVVEYLDMMSRYGTELTLYAQWEPIRYNVVYKGNDNWNTEQGEYKQKEVRFDQRINLLDNKFSRNAGSEVRVTRYSGGYEFIGWGTSGEQNIPTYTDKQAVVNLRNTSGDYIIYALWKKTVALRFNLNGGTYKSNPSEIVVNADIYNSIMEYTFNINNGKTGNLSPKYSEQRGTIDAYGVFDANGLNNIYKKSTDGQTFRFCGWSLSSGDNLEDILMDYCTYNGGKKNTYTLHDNTTLYAVWEPILELNFEVNRVLGNLSFEDGSQPKTGLKSLTAVSTNNMIGVIIRPGEQGSYKTVTHGNGIEQSVIFEKGITDIYDIEGLWTDNLNPSTDEDIKDEQTHGLNRKFEVNKGLEERTFYIPTYSGTESSYPGDAGRNKYGMLVDFSRPSFYWQYVHGKDEEIIVNTLIYITLDANSTETSEVDSVLDDLRTELRVRVH